MAITIDELKRNVFPGESGGDYNALFGYANRPGGQFSGVNLTDMTVDQALQFANPSGPYGQSVKGQIGRVATPMGAYQVVGTTLRGAKEGLGLTGNEVMTPQLQDAIGMWIYRNQGPQAWEAWGGGQGGGNVTRSSKGTGMGLLDMQAQQPQTFGQKIGEGLRSGSLMDNLALAFNSLRMNPDQNLAAMVGQRQEQRGQEQAANRTAQWLRSRGHDDLASALEAGSIDAGSTVNEALSRENPAAGAERGVVVGGNVVDPITGEVIYQGPAQSTEPLAPAAFVAMDMQAKAAGFEPGTPEYKDFMATRGAGLAAESRAIGEQRGAAIAGAPAKTEMVNMIEGQINELLADPYLPEMLGPMASRLPNVSGDAARVQAKMDQLTGGAFLQARDLLKGGGGITDFESKKAESAFIRMNAAQNEADFRAAMEDFRSAVRSGLPKLDAPGAENLSDDEFLKRLGL